MTKKKYSSGNLFFFEIKKLAASRKNWAVIAILCVTLFLFVAYNMQQEQTERRKTAAECDFLVTWYGYKTDVYQDFYKQFGGEALNAYVGISGERAAYFERLAAAIRSGDKTEILRAKTAYCAAQADYHAWIAAYMEEGRLEEELMRIPGDLSGALMMALYPNAGTAEYYTAQAAFYSELTESKTLPITSLYEMTGFHFLYRFMTTLFPIVVMIIAFLLLSDSMSAEKDSGSYKFLLLQPVSRAKVIAVKVIAGAVYAAAVVLVTVLLTFLLTGFVNGFGSPDYPVLSDPKAYTSLTAPVSTYNDDLSCMQYRGVYADLNMQRDTAFSAFELHGDGLHLGISPYSAQGKFGLAAPDEQLALMPMWAFLLLSLSILPFFFILAAAAAVCISAFSYNGTLSLILCAICGLALVPCAFAAYSPFQTVNCGLLAAGLGGQTMLSATLISLLTTVLLYGVTTFFFKKKDIFC